MICPIWFELTCFDFSTQEHYVPFNYLRVPIEPTHLDINSLQLGEELEVYASPRENEPPAWWRSRVKKKGDSVSGLSHLKNNQEINCILGIIANACLDSTNIRKLVNHMVKLKQTMIQIIRIQIINVNKFFNESHYNFILIIFFLRITITFQSSYVTIQRNFIMLWEPEIFQRFLKNIFISGQPKPL